MLSMEAYLSLYDSTTEPKWLERAKAAAVPSYAKLYNYTKDQHHLDVACVLLQRHEVHFSFRRTARRETRISWGRRE